MSQINRKLQTRKALINSALKLVGEGQLFSSLSLREVAKRAGVVPNAFYRHFKSLDELGLALADEVGLLLRQLMRQARLQGIAADRMISDSVDFFIDNVMENPTLFRFMSQSMAGGSEGLREAIRNELSFFAKEMVMDLNRLRILTHIETYDLDMIGHLVVQTVSGIAGEILDLPEHSENLVKGIRERTIKQLRLIFLGASMWNPKIKKEAPKTDFLSTKNQTKSYEIPSKEQIAQEEKEAKKAKKIAQEKAKALAKAQAKAKKDAQIKAKTMARAQEKAEKEAYLKAKALAKAKSKAEKDALAQAKAIEDQKKHR